MSDEIIKGYKATDNNMQCRGFQFKIGKSYHEEDVEICRKGFHFCTNPLDIFDYYSPAEALFFGVDGFGKTATHGEDSKVVCSDITIKASITLHNFILSGIDFLFNKRTYKKKTSKHSTGNRSASSATGNSSASSATGDSSASSATGNSSASSATGDSSASSATGYRSASSATGYRSASSATGNSSASSATGNSSASSATGDSSASICTGINSKAMAGEYGCIALAWYNIKEKRSEMRCAEIGCGDGTDGKLKAGVFYLLDNNGKFIEE